MKIVEKQGIRLVDFGASVHGIAAERIEIGWAEFCTYAEEHGADKAVRYLKRDIVPRILPDGELAFNLQYLAGTEKP